MGVLALIGVVASATAGIVGAIVGARIAAGAVAREGERQREDAAAARVREWNIRRLEETRTQLASIADGFLVLMDNKDAAASKAHLRRANTMLFANARLVGDRDALAAMAAAVAGATSALPANRIYRSLLVAATNPFTEQQRAAMRDARSLVCGFHWFWTPCFAANGHPVSPETDTAESGERRNTHEPGELRWVVEDRARTMPSVRRSRG